MTPMNMLWSYAYAQRLKVDQFISGLPVEQLRFFADSGAHSARTLGIHIGPDDYAAWVKKWEPWFTVYSNLDVIGAPQATRDNQTYLEEVHGLSPMPVFHTGEPFNVLESYLEDGYTYIALGKLLGNPVPVLRRWLTKCFQLADGHAVFHGFGMTTWSLLKIFPFYTVDSSSWGAAFRYGRLGLFHQGRWYTINLRDQDALHRNRQVVDAYQLPYRVFTRQGYDRPTVAGAAAAAFYRAAAWLHKLHGPVYLPPGRGYPTGSRAGKVMPAAVGPATYLAEAAEDNHRFPPPSPARRCPDRRTGMTTRTPEPPFPDYVPGVTELVDVGPFPVYFGNVNQAMGLRGHYHTAEVRVIFQTLGRHGYPSFQDTNDVIRGKLRYLTDGIFRDATNEDVARRLWKALDGWVPPEWEPWGGQYHLHTLHLDVQGVNDDIGHDASTTRYTITRYPTQPLAGAR